MQRKDTFTAIDFDVFANFLSRSSKKPNLEERSIDWAFKFQVLPQISIRIKGILLQKNKKGYEEIT